MAIVGNYLRRKALQCFLVSQVTGIIDAGLLVNHTYLRTVFLKFPGNGPADPLRAAGYHSNFSLKHIFSPFFFPYVLIYGDTISL